MIEDLFFKYNALHLELLLFYHLFPLWKSPCARVTGISTHCPIDWIHAIVFIIIFNRLVLNIRAIYDDGSFHAIWTVWWSPLQVKEAVKTNTMWLSWLSFCLNHANILTRFLIVHYIIVHIESLLNSLVVWIESWVEPINISHVNLGCNSGLLTHRGEKASRSSLWVMVSIFLLVHLSLRLVFVVDLRLFIEHVIQILNII